MRFTWQIFCIGLLGFVFAGCGPSESVETDSSGSGGASSAATDDRPKAYQISDLPDVEDSPLPVADQGRIQFTLPAGWKTLPRKAQFLVACIPEENSPSQLPRITITADDPPGDNKSSTTIENASELAAALQAQHEKANRKLIESCKPLQLGDNVWVRHVRRAAYSDGAAAIQSLQTVQSGRLYTVELTVNAKDNPRKSNDFIYQESLKAHRDFGYAVAAHVKFPKEGSAPAADPPEAEKPAAKPADEKSAESKNGEKQPDKSEKK